MSVRIVAALLLTAGAAPTQAQAPASPTPAVPRRPAPTCIDTSFSPNWAPLDARTILVRATGRVWRVTTTRCPALEAPMARITVVQRSGAVCGPLDARLYVSGGGDVVGLPCAIETIAPLTEPEARALEKARR